MFFLLEYLCKKERENLKFQKYKSFLKNKIYSKIKIYVSHLIFSSLKKIQNNIRKKTIKANNVRELVVVVFVVLMRY